MQFAKELLDKLIEFVVEKQVEVNVTIQPEYMEIHMEPWKPYEAKCPYGRDNDV